MQVLLQSFGFKYGEPAGADLLIDCRVLQNPHRRKDLRYLNGLDERVRMDVLIGARASRLLDWFEARIAAAAEGGAQHVGVGCTAGRHRSVVVARELAERLRRRGIGVIVDHRDLKIGGDPRPAQAPEVTTPCQEGSKKSSAPS